MSSDEKPIENTTEAGNEVVSSSTVNGNTSTTSENNLDGSKNTVDSDEEEEVYTLEELTGICDDADAVLGASDPDNCSYSQGYMPRQALYACITCNNPKDPEASRAGVCLACANKCHEGHNLVELYTKRNFRCDCGNRKFRGHACALLPNKEPENNGNSYNHNFDGLYCTCARPYPDLEFPENESDMIQCVVCEDWFHDKHVFGDYICMAEKNTNVDKVEKEPEAEMICVKCTQHCDFLQYYPELIFPMKPMEQEAMYVVGNVDEAVLASNASTDSASAAVCKPSTTDETPVSDIAASTSCNGVSGPVELANAASSASQENTAGATTETQCLIANKTKTPLSVERGTLWFEHWRKQLCKCDRCVNNYYKLGVSYITDENDTLTAYEAIGKTKLADEEKAKDVEIDNMWNKLDHVAKVEAMIGINEMKEQLREFMMKFDGKVVRRKDVEEFKEGLAAKRARRMEDFTGVPPSNCH